MSEFIFNNKKYKYFKHPYNSTYTNERAVEIPIFKDLVDKYKDKRILEVGNVMKNYHSFKHDIVDLYEIDEGVINKDIRDYKTDKKYDLIISVSTIEHVDELVDSTSEQGILDALDSMRNLIAPFGDIYISVPIAPNPSLNNLIINNKLGLKEAYYMKKDMFDDDKFNNNIWEQCKFSDIHTFSPCVCGYNTINKNGEKTGFLPIIGAKVIYLLIGRL